MTAVYFSDHKTQGRPELLLRHGIAQSRIALIKKIIHTVFGRVPIQTGMCGFQDAAEQVVIGLQDARSKLFMGVKRFPGSHAGNKQADRDQRERKLFQDTACCHKWRKILIL